MAAPGALIKDLLTDHRDQIDELAKRVNEYLSTQNDEELKKAAAEFPIDDLCLLKFILSALKKKTKIVDVACENLCATLQFRKTNCELLKTARATREFQYYLPGTGGGFLGDNLVVVTYFGQTDTHELARKYGSTEAVVRAGYFVSEQTRIKLDKRTLETGRLSKLLSIVDLKGMSLGKALNRSVMNAMGMVSKSNEINTPQLLARIIIQNAPAVLQVVLSMMRPLISKPTAEKIGSCGKKSSMTDISLCPFVNSFPNGIASIPESLGGSFKPE
jgi:hypothetical protein